METLNIYLLRHGRPDYPYEGKIYYGSTDYPLSEEGKKQAERVHRDLAKIDFNGIYASPMKRAQETTKIVFPDNFNDVVTVDDFREIDFGSWETKRFDEISKETWDSVYGIPGRTFDLSAPPGGERLLDVQRRVIPAFNNVLTKHKSGNIVISAHNGVIWSIVSHVLKIPLREIFFYNMDYCGIHVLSGKGNFIKLKRFNWNSELNHNHDRRII